MSRSRGPGPTDDRETIREIRAAREEQKLRTLENLIRAIDRYRAELRRDGRGHKGRLGKWEGKLQQAIRWADEAMNAGSIAKKDLEERELRERGERIARGEKLVKRP